MSFFDTATLVDYKSVAKKKLPPYLFDFIEGGAFDEDTLQSNKDDYKPILLRKRVLTGSSNLDTSTQLFGKQLDMPLILAPVGFAGVFAKRGEVQVAKAAKNRGVPYCHSSTSICSMEEVYRATNTPFWYQFYPLKDRSISKELLKKAKSLGTEVLVLTIDLPSVGIRHRYQKSLTDRSRLVEVFKYFNWVKNVRLTGGPLVLGDFVPYATGLTTISSMRKWLASQLVSDLSWDDIEWVRKEWHGKLILKGIMDADDIRHATKEHVDAIIVSNHGGRHIDSIPSTIKVLSSIVDTSQVPVLVDGGISNGLDMVKALAMGAKACLIGRSWAYALAAEGERGVEMLLKRYQNELKSVMSQIGVSKIDDLPKGLL